MARRVMEKHYWAGAVSASKALGPIVMIPDSCSLCGEDTPKVPVYAWTKEYAAKGRILFCSKCQDTLSGECSEDR